MLARALSVAAVAAVGRLWLTGWEADGLRILGGVAAATPWHFRKWHLARGAHARWASTLGAVMERYIHGAGHAS